MTCADLVAMLSLMGDSYGFKMSGPGDVGSKEQAEMQEYADGAQDFPYIPEFFFEAPKHVLPETTKTIQCAPVTEEALICKKQPVTTEDPPMPEPLLTFESTFHNQYWRNDR